MEVLPKELFTREHRFFHVDRWQNLQECQDILLDGNNLSRFGTAYWAALNSKKFEEFTDTEKREYYLESVRKQPAYVGYASRFQSIFAANTIEDALIFANHIIPQPDNPINIIEVFGNRFWNLDSNWLDFAESLNDISYFINYWEGKLTNHHPIEGDRKPPLIEVMIGLPARTGKVVQVIS